METKDVIRANLKTCLKASGKNQTDLANALGVSPSAVSNWIRGVHNIDIEYVPDICRFLGIPIARLFDDSPRDLLRVRVPFAAPSKTAGRCPIRTYLFFIVYMFVYMFSHSKDKKISPATR